MHIFHIVSRCLCYSICICNLLQHLLSPLISLFSPHNSSSSLPSSFIYLWHQSRLVRCSSLASHTVPHIKVLCLLCARSKASLITEPEPILLAPRSFTTITFRVKITELRELLEIRKKPSLKSDVLFDEDVTSLDPWGFLLWWRGSGSCDTMCVNRSCSCFLCSDLENRV